VLLTGCRLGFFEAGLRGEGTVTVRGDSHMKAVWQA